METRELTSKTGKTYKVSNLNLIARDNQLCNDLFGCNVPREMSTSKQMAWADAHYRQVSRLLENYKAVFLSAKEEYSRDGNIFG